MKGRDVKRGKEVGVLFQRSFFETILAVPTDAARVECIRLLYEYAYKGVEPDERKVDNYALLFFKMARPVVDASRERYETCRENGSKGGRRPTSDNGADSPAGAKTRYEKGHIPTRDEVRNMCRARGYKVPADQFYLMWKDRQWKDRDGYIIDWVGELEKKEEELERIGGSS